MLVENKKGNLMIALAVFCARDWNRTSTSLRTADFESAASTNSATRATFYERVFKNSFPTPDFKYLSFILAEILSGNSTEYINEKGLYAFVDLFSPLLCSFSLLSK